MAHDTLKEDVLARVAIQDVISKHVKLKRAGDRKLRGLCPFHAEKTPSFYVDEANQFFKCFGCDAKGDLFSFQMQIYGVGFRAALEQLADEFGIGRSQSGEQRPPKKRVIKKRDTSQEEEERQRKTQARIHNLLHECDVKFLRYARKYLEGRGLSSELPPDCIVAHPGLWHRESKREWPAMIALLREGYQDPVGGIQRIYLSRDGRKKAPIDPRLRKKALGKTKGRAVWMIDSWEFGLWPWSPPTSPALPYLPSDPKGELWITEGIETGIALYQYLGTRFDCAGDSEYKDFRHWAVAAAFSASNLKNLKIPPGIDHIIIAADKDRPCQQHALGTGQAKAIEAARHYAAQGYTTEIKLPPLKIPEGQKSLDWLDMIVRIKGGRW